MFIKLKRRPGKDLLNIFSCFHVFTFIARVFQKHDVPLAAIPCLHQILGKKQQEKYARKRKETVLAASSQPRSKRTKTCNVIPEVKREEMSAGCKASDSRAAEHIDDSDGFAIVTAAHNQFLPDASEGAPPIALGKISYLLLHMRKILSFCNVE